MKGCLLDDFFAISSCVLQEGNKNIVSKVLKSKQAGEKWVWEICLDPEAQPPWPGTCMWCTSVPKLFVNMTFMSASWQSVGKSGVLKNTSWFGTCCWHLLVGSRRCVYSLSSWQMRPSQHRHHQSTGKYEVIHLKPESGPYNSRSYVMFTVIRYVPGAPKPSTQTPSPGRVLETRTRQVNQQANKHLMSVMMAVWKESQDKWKRFMGASPSRGQEMLFWWMFFITYFTFISLY